MPAIVSGCAVLVLVASLVASRATTQRGLAPPPGRVSPTPTQTRTLVGQGIYTLFYADGNGGFTVASPDGSTLQVGPSASSGARLVPTANFVTYANGGHAFSLARPFLGVPADLGPGDRVFPSMTSGLVGVMRGGDSGPFSVQFVPVGPGLGLGRGPFALPGGYDPIAETASGILVTQVPSGQLQLWKPAATGFGTFVRTFSKSADMVDVSADQVAWRALDACDATAECPMHISTISTGADQTVTPPDGHHGFLGGGAFDPSGNQIAAFVGGSPVGSAPRAQLTIVGYDPLAQGPYIAFKGQVVPKSTVEVGQPRGAAVWSPDGNVVFFSGLSGSMHLYHPGSDTTDTLDRPASYNFAVF